MEKIGLKPKVRRIGLTGTFCSGKSTVGKIFAQLGANYINADEVVSELLTEKLIQTDIEKIIGRKVFNFTDYKKRLSRILFQDVLLLNKYCGYLYPIVCERMKAKEEPNLINIWEVPLLYEAGWDVYMDKIVLVVSPQKDCESRALRRGFTIEEFSKRIALFYPEQDKKKKADFVLYNDGSLDQLRKKVMTIWNIITKGEGYA